eukprot:3449954-Amphidinium_carterae.1
MLFSNRMHECSVAVAMVCGGVNCRGAVIARRWLALVVGRRIWVTAAEVWQALVGRVVGWWRSQCVARLTVLSASMTHIVQPRREAEMKASSVLPFRIGRCVVRSIKSLGEKDSCCAQSSMQCSKTSRTDKRKLSASSREAFGLAEHVQAGVECAAHQKQCVGHGTSARSRCAGYSHVVPCALVASAPRCSSRWSRALVARSFDLVDALCGTRCTCHRGGRCCSHMMACLGHWLCDLLWRVQTVLNGACELEVDLCEDVFSGLNDERCSLVCGLHDVLVLVAGITLVVLWCSSKLDLSRLVVLVVAVDVVVFALGLLGRGRLGVNVAAR